MRFRAQIDGITDFSQHAWSGGSRFAGFTGGPSPNAISPGGALLDGGNGHSCQARPLWAPLALLRACVSTLRRSPSSSAPAEAGGHGGASSWALRQEDAESPAGRADTAGACRSGGSARFRLVEDPTQPGRPQIRCQWTFARRATGEALS